MSRQHSHIHVRLTFINFGQTGQLLGIEHRPLGAFVKGHGSVPEALYVVVGPLHPREGSGTIRRPNTARQPVWTRGATRVKGKALVLVVLAWRKY